MADKTIDIELKTTADTSGATSVKDVLEEIKSEAQVTEDTLQEAFNTATAEVERLESALEEAELNGDDIQADIIADELADARERAEELEEALNNFDSSNMEDMNSTVQEYSDNTDTASSSTDTLAMTIASIDPTVIDQIRDSMAEYGSQTQESASATDDLMEAMVSGGVATGLGNTFMGLANKAGEYNDSMQRMGLALEGHAMTVDEVSNRYGASVSKMANETGRGAGSVRNHFATMAIAGVKNQDILEQSFQAVANGAFFSGESIESLTNKFQRITMQGTLSKKQLAGLGLTMEDLAKTMGVSADEVSDKFKEMTAEQRASVLSQASAMKFGTDVNGVFKNSWEGLWTSLNKASEGFQRLVGELLLPYLIPAVQTAVDIIGQLTDTFKALPQPFKDIIGVLMVFGTGISTVGLGLNAVSKIASMAIGPFANLYKYFMVVPDGKKLTPFRQQLQSIRTTAGNVKTSLSNLATTVKTTVMGAFTTVKNFFTTQFIPTLRNVGTALLNVGKRALTAGFNALKSVAMWLAKKGAMIADAIATGYAAVAQWALNSAILANPITWIVVAIIALIAVLGYLYFNNEQVRQAIDGLWQSLVGLGQFIYGVLLNAWNTLVTTLQNFWNYIVGLGANITSQVGITGNNVINGIIGFLVFFATLPIRIGVILVNALAKALGFGDNFVQNLVSAGSNAVSGFLNSIGEMASGLANELSNMLSLVGEWAATLPQKFWDAGVNAVQNFLSALGIASPGTMQRTMAWEVSEMGKNVPENAKALISNISKLGTNVVDSFGNPQLEMGYDINSTANANMSNSSDTQGFGTVFRDLILNIQSVDSDERVNQIVEAVRRELSWDNATAGRTV